MFFWRARWFKPWPNFVDSRLLEVTFSTFDSRVTFLPSQKGHERKNLILKKDGAIFFVDFYGTLVGKYTSPMNPMWGCYKGCHLGLVLKLLVDVHLLNWSSGLILWFVFVSIRVYDVFFPQINQHPWSVDRLGWYFLVVSTPTSPLKGSDRTYLGRHVAGGTSPGLNLILGGIFLRKSRPPGRTNLAAPWGRIFQWKQGIKVGEIFFFQRIEGFQTHFLYGPPRKWKTIALVEDHPMVNNHD